MYGKYSKNTVICLDVCHPRCVKSNITVYNMYVVFLTEYIYVSTYILYTVITVICVFEKQNYFNIHNFSLLGPLTSQSKTKICGRSPAEIVGSNFTGDMDVCLL